MCVVVYDIVILWCYILRRPSAVNRTPVNQAPQHRNPPHHVCQPPRKQTGLFIATGDKHLIPRQMSRLWMFALLAIARQTSHPLSILAKEQARRSRIRHGVDQWHLKRHRNRVLVVQRQQESELALAAAYGGRWRIVDGGKALPKHWEVSMRGHWIIMEQIMTIFCLEALAWWKEKFGGDTNVKFHVIWATIFGATVDIEPLHSWAHIDLLPKITSVKMPLCCGL